MNDLLQYENDYVIQTKTRHRTPVVRTTSIANMNDSASLKRVTSLSRTHSLAHSLRLKRNSMKQHYTSRVDEDSGSSSPELDSTIGHDSTDFGKHSRLEFIQYLDLVVVF